MVIPVNYGQANVFLQGPDAPRGAQVTWGFHNVAAGTAADTAAVIGATWSADVMPQLHSGIEMLQVKVKLGPNDTGDEALVPFSTAGSVSGDGYSPQVAALVVKLTSVGGRKGRGRMFIPGLYEGTSTGGGVFGSGALSAWQTTFDTFFDDLAAADIPMFLLHTDSTAPTEVNALVVSSLFASQRRRIRKVGGRRPVGP